MQVGNRALAELVGTFWLVFGGCGSAALAAAFPQVGIGLIGVSFAFGPTVLTMAYSIGHSSGCHLKPAMTAGLDVAKRFPASKALHYILAQVLSGIAGGTSLVRDRQRQSRLRRFGWICVERLRAALSRRLRDGSGLGR